MSQRDIQRQRRLLTAVEVVLIASIAVAGVQIAGPLTQIRRAQAGSGERERILTALGVDLDTRYSREHHYNPDRAEDPAWYGLSPRAFPPGTLEPWASDARWNRLEYRAVNGARYRYGLFTDGQEAWLMAYGDADGDGVLSEVFRRYERGRLVQDWRIREEE